MRSPNEKGFEVNTPRSPNPNTHSPDFHSPDLIGQYHEHGWKLCAIPPGGKGPKTKGWNTPQGAINPEALPPGHGVGLLHAFSGTMALDIDDLAAAVSALAAHGIDLEALMNAPDAVQIVSGRPNRAKLLFSVPPFLRLPSVKANGLDGCIFEIRCSTAEGLSVQDVLPPSIHPDLGTPYQWAGDWRKLPDCPDALIQCWVSLLPAPERDTTTSASTHDLTEVRSALEAVPADVGYSEWVAAGMAVHAATAGAAQGFELWDQWSAKCEAKYKASEMPGKWASFMPAPGAVPVGPASLFKLAHEHGWQGYTPDITGLFGPVPGAAAPAGACHPLARFISLKDAMKPTRWLIPNLIQEGLVLIAGSPGVGKTSNLLPTLVSVAHLGDPANQTIRPPARRKILWITEDSSQAKRIINGMVYAGWFTLDQSEEWIKIVDAHKLPIEQIVTLEPEIRHLSTEAQGAHGLVTLKPLIVFDTLSAVVAVDNENDNAEISKVMAGLKTAFAGYPVVVAAHTSKALKGRSDARELAVRGASAWEGDAHQTMYLVEDDGTRFLVFGKTRFERHESFDVEFTSHTTQTLLSGDFGLEMSTLRWSTCRTVSIQDKIRTREETANAKKEIQRLADRDVKAAAMVECISANWKSGGAIGRNALYSKISGKRAYLMDALEHLIQTGAVVEFTPPGSRYSALYPLTESEREQVTSSDDPIRATAESINLRYPP